MLNARQLGHSSVTEGIYGHWSRTASRREAQKTRELLESAKA